MRTSYTSISIRVKMPRSSSRADPMELTRPRTIASELSTSTSSLIGTNVVPSLVEATIVNIRVSKQAKNKGNLRIMRRYIEFGFHHLFFARGKGQLTSKKFSARLRWRRDRYSTIALTIRIQGARGAVLPSNTSQATTSFPPWACVRAKAIPSESAWTT